MSVFKSQFTRAIAVNASNDCDIPSPYVIVSSTTTDGNTNQLIDSTVNFIDLNVQAGDIVYSAGAGATVVGVVDENTLELNATPAGVGDPYIVYQASSQTGLGNQGCCLLGANDGPVGLTTIGGDEVMVYISRGNILPLQVKKVISGDVIALW